MLRSVRSSPDLPAIMGKRADSPAFNLPAQASFSGPHPMQRLIFQPAALIILLSVTSWSHAADAPPNIVFIFTDDHCEQALSAYDPSRITTPNLDRIANEGMRFDRCYVTNSICGPSRAVIQTGKYSHLNGFIRNGNRFNGDQQTFPKLLQAHGYQTAVVGKWHLASTPQGYARKCCACECRRTTVPRNAILGRRLV